MKLSFTLFLFLIALLIASSCNKGPTGGVPFYLKMDTAVVVPFKNFSASSNTQNIEDVWMEANSSNLGAYELPCLFPVLLQDSVRFVISPGVWTSGQSINPIIYPLMNPDIFTLAATPGNVYTHVPTFTYKAGDTVTFNEDFEGGSDYNSNMTKTNVGAKYGTSCGRITVGPNDSSVIACQAYYNGHNTPYPLTPGQEIWIEVDYKSDVPVWAGIIPHYSDNTTDTLQILLLLPTTNWTKVYIKLSDTVGNLGASTFNLFFQGLNPYGSPGGSAYLDNIKLIHLLN